ELDAEGARLPLELRPLVACRVERAHPKRHRPAPDRLADPSRPEQAQGPPTELEPEQQVRMPAGPLTALTSSVPATTRRAQARMSAHVRSAVASVRTSGVLVTLTPRSSAATTSTLSCPTAQLATILSLGRYLSSVPPTQRDSSGTMAT